MIRQNSETTLVFSAPFSNSAKQSNSNDSNYEQCKHHVWNSPILAIACGQILYQKRQGCPDRNSYALRHRKFEKIVKTSHIARKYKKRMTNGRIFPFSLSSPPGVNPINISPN